MSVYCDGTGCLDIQCHNRGYEYCCADYISKVRRWAKLVSTFAFKNWTRSFVYMSIIMNQKCSNGFNTWREINV